MVQQVTCSDSGENTLKLVSALLRALTTPQKDSALLAAAVRGMSR